MSEENLLEQITLRDHIQRYTYINLITILINQGLSILMMEWARTTFMDNVINSYLFLPVGFLIGTGEKQTIII